MSYENAKKHTLIFQEPPACTPCDKVPDGPLLGNGDIGVAVSAQPELGRIGFHIGKNDIWNSYSHWETPGIRSYGALYLDCPQAAGSYRAEQHLADASVNVFLDGKEAALCVSSAVLRKTGLILQEIHCTKGTARIHLELVHTNREEEASTRVTKERGRITGYKAIATPLQQWPCKASSITRVLDREDTAFSLVSGETVRIVTTLHTNQESECFEALCENELAELKVERLAQLQRSHNEWWQAFWNESSLHIPSQPLLERFWYASHYLMACCCEEGKFAPGLFGSWVTTDTPAWCGDYHLNYNYEAPWWGLYSSNHIGITEAYDRPLLDYMPAAKKAAREKLGCRGLYTLVGIGPKGLRTAALTDKVGNDDVNYWGQKSNAAYGAVNMLMRFYCTYDRDYGEKTAYPYLAETVRFWLDYLCRENGRYVIRNDCVFENQAAARGVFDWADENTPDDGGQCNPLLSLGLIRMLLRGLLDICRECGIQSPEREQWQQVLEHLSEFPTMERNGKRVFRLTEDGTDWCDNNSLAIQHIFPAGCVGLGSSPDLLETGRETFRQMERWEDYNAFPTYFPAGARLGIAPEILLSHLNEQIQKHSFPNGFLFFGGGGIECCSGVPCTLNEMLMQSHEGIIRLFPVWDRNRDAAFTTLRAYGAFLVSASVRGGKLGPVTVFSEKGRPCALQVPGAGKLTVRNGNREIPVSEENGVFRFDTRPGESYNIQTCSSE